MPETIRLVTSLPDEWVKAQQNRYVDERHYETLIGDRDTDVLKPDGSPLLKFRRRVLPADVCERARPALRDAGSSYSGYRNWHSGIVGYFDKGEDRNSSECQTTAFTRDHLDKWGSCLPFIRAVNGVFRRYGKRRYLTQRKLALRTDQQFVIADTAFTTMTVNLWDAGHDARTPLHQDDGDLREGFGVISVISSGSYSGGYLVFPKYRVAVDMRTRDVLLADVHEFHGNTPISGEPGL